MLYKRTFTSGNFFFSCDVSYPEVSRRAIDDARVAGVTFSLCSSYDNSTVFRRKLSALATELRRSPFCN